MNLADDDEKNLLSSLVATLLFLTEDFFDFGLTSLTNVHRFFVKKKKALAIFLNIWYNIIYIYIA